MFRYPFPWKQCKHDRIDVLLKKFLFLPLMEQLSCPHKNIYIYIYKIKLDNDSTIMYVIIPSN